MENVVDSPCWRKFQPISNRSEDFGDLEGSFMFRSHLLVVLGFEVPSVEPNQLIQFESREFVFVSFGHALSSLFVGGDCFFLVLHKLLNLFFHRRKFSVFECCWYGEW